MMLRGMGALPATYEDCHALMCRAFQGYQPTIEENLACSELRGSFEGRSFSPLECVGQPTPVAATEDVEDVPLKTAEQAVVTAALLPAPTMKYGPLPLVPNSSTGLSFGWRVPKQCYPTLSALTPQCPSPTWFYLLLGVAAVAGLSSRKRKN